MLWVPPVIWWCFVKEKCPLPIARFMFGKPQTARRYRTQDAMAKSLARYQAFKPTTSRFWTIRAPCLTGVARQDLYRVGQHDDRCGDGEIIDGPARWKVSTMPIWNAYCPGSSVCSMRQNGACPSPRHSVTAFEIAAVAQNLLEETVIWA